jgi:hypothetical protein
MNPKIRQRAIRNFVAALLQSDLSLSEMHELSEDLIHGSLGRELGEFMLDAMINIPDSPSQTSSFSSPRSAQDLAYDLIMRRRLPKKSVLQLITLASPGIKPKHFPPNGTLRELIDKFFVYATSNEVEKFLNILEGEPADAYMKGIARRDRGR